MQTATTIPLSLKDPLGLQPSTFIYTSAPIFFDKKLELSNGVEPSPIEIGFASPISIKSL